MEDLEGLEDLEHLEDALEKVDKAEKGDEDEDEKTKTEETNEDKETNDSDARVAGTISSFYELLAKKEFHSSRNPIIMPITLSISIYGISGILPGNLFRVDYLSKVHFENVLMGVGKWFHFSQICKNPDDTRTNPKI